MSSIDHITYIGLKFGKKIEKKKVAWLNEKKSIIKKKENKKL